MKSKYNIRPIQPSAFTKGLPRIAAFVNALVLSSTEAGKETRLALFFDKSMAQKVCDLLNEVSRSQGKY